MNIYYYVDISIWQHHSKCMNAKQKSSSKISVKPVHVLDFVVSCCSQNNSVGVGHSTVLKYIFD